MRKKNNGNIRHNAATDEEEIIDLLDSGSEGVDNNTEDGPVNQDFYHVIDKEDGITSGSGSSEQSSRQNTLNSVGNGKESKTSCSGRMREGNSDHCVETGIVKTDAELRENDLELESEIIGTDSIDDNLSSVIDNPWYSVKARRGDDGLKQFVFICRICDKLCNRRANMEDHIRSHAGIKPFSCKFCHVKLSRKQNLKSHFIKMHKFSEEKVKSLLEEVDLPDPAVNCRELRQYVRDNEKYDRQMNQNNKRTISESTADHTDQNLENSPKLEKFPKIALNNEAKNLNEESVIVPNEEESTHLEEESKVLEDYGEFTCIEVEHDGTPSKLYQCKTCQYKCARRYTMKTHTLTHTGVKQYCCEICDAEYTKNTFLKVHLAKDHSISHPELDEMVKRASMKTNHKNHLNSYNDVAHYIGPCIEPNGYKVKTGNIDEINNEEADVVKSFLQREKHNGQDEESGNDIDDELLDTTVGAKDKEYGEKVEDYGNFTCIEVADKFSQSKVYRCKVCGYECMRRYTMKTHAWTHSGYKRFCCIFCGNSFTRSTYFRFHLRKAHSVIGSEMDRIVREARKQDLDDFNPQNVLSSDDESVKYLSGESREASPLKENLSQLQQDLKVTKNAVEEKHIDDKLRAEFGRNDDCLKIDGKYLEDKQRENEIINTAVIDDNFQDDSLLNLSEHSSKESSVEKELLASDESIMDAIETIMDCDSLQCLKCLKMFSTKTNLKSHVKTHFNIKPYGCPICPKYFGKNRNMKEHAKKMHNFLGPFPESDALAHRLKGKSVSKIPIEEEQTVAHLETTSESAESSLQTQFSSNGNGYHTNEDDLIDNENNTEKHTLQFDETMFMDVENLRCLKCYKTYTSKGNLKAHVKLHFNLRPYACPVCKQKFNNSSNMKVHAKKMHNYTTFSTDYSSDVAVKEVIDAFKLKYPEAKATHLIEKQGRNVINLSENPKMDTPRLGTSIKYNDKVDVTVDNLRDTSSVVRNDKTEMDVTGISFETMAEKLWGYNDAVSQDPSKDTTMDTKEIERKKRKENADKLESSVQNTDSSPEKVMKHETLDKTDYNSMMTDLMRMAGSGIQKHPGNNAVNESFGMNTSFTPPVNMNIPDNLTHSMEKLEQEDILTTAQKKVNKSLSALDVTHLAGAYANTRKNDLKVDMDFQIKFNSPSPPKAFIAEQIPTEIFPGVPTSPYADPNIVKLKTLMDEDNLQCRDCLKRFANKWSLKAHVKAIHLKGKQFTCSACFKSFNFKCNLERHYVVHNPNWTKEAAPFEPFLHTAEAGDSSADNDDGGKESGELGNADAGGEDSRSRESFSDAESSDKASSNTESPKKHVSDIESLRKHSEITESPSKLWPDDDPYNAEVEALMDLDYFQCRKCLKQFANKWSLKAHVKSIHVQSRKYNCPVCQKSFNHKCNLDRHMVIHPEYDPKKEAEFNESSEFQCSFCQKSFANKWSLKAHMNSIHVNARQYVCHLCQKMFNHKCNLERHIIKHVGEGGISVSFESETDEMPLDLSSDSGKDDDLMNKTRQDSEVIEITQEKQKDNTDSVSFDERILMDMDKMKCIKCGKRFGDKSELKEHVKGHIDRNLTCGICKRSFTSTEKLKRHYNVHFTNSEFGKDDRVELPPGDVPSKIGGSENVSGESYIPDDQIVIRDDTPDSTKELKVDKDLPSPGCEDDGPVYCGLCGDEFPNRNDLHAHFKIHEDV